MALRYQAEAPKKAAPGHILLVVHDFEARSSDELSLAKGDRIELIERDDDFGDGWYLGRHMLKGTTGLFPEVYTTSAPKGTTGVASTTTSNHRPAPKPGVGSTQSMSALPGGLGSGLTSTISPTSFVSMQPNNAPSNTTTTTIPPPEKTTSPPLGNNPMAHRTSSSWDYSNRKTSSDVSAANVQRSASLASVVNASMPGGEDSPVMNETLSVIQEHITDMHTPRHSILNAERRGTNDSGSDYSSHLDHRLSYITGHETDEEEEQAHSREEVMKWDPAQVAEYLGEVGVDAQHCSVFVEQEISGEVLLGMEQATILIKDLDLGPVGRRLKTWHKIKALQDEAKLSARISARQSKALQAGIETLRDSTSGNIGSPPNSGLPRIPGLAARADSKAHPGSRIVAKRPDLDPARSPYLNLPGPENPARPSAASVRQMNHSRRHSSADFALGMAPEASSDGSIPNSPAFNQSQGSSHRKQPSFDRNWTMGLVNAAPGPPNGRPGPGARRESFGTPPRQTSSTEHVPGTAMRSATYTKSHTPDFERGYMSGGEAENRKSRTLLKKRDSPSSHFRTSSYTEEQRQRSATAHSRQSRFGSADSIRDASLPPPSMTGATPRASQQFFNRDAQGRLPKLKDVNTAATIQTKQVMTSPTVTKLEYEATSPGGSEPPSYSLWGRKATAAAPPLVSPNSTAPPPPDPAAGPRLTGLRAISDAVTGTEKAGARTATPILETVTSPTIKESSIQSPTSITTNDGASTTSSSKNPDQDSSESARDSTNAATTPQLGPSNSTGTSRRKAKKETSAYTRGLELKTPSEQMVGCDYSGWMKKKNHKLMTTWKPRLFVLRGRRLSYYYSEQDTQEKGLIDISSHRVLPANSDRITGLHATITGASNSPTSPQNAQMPTIAATEAAAQPPVIPERSGPENIFIFKLVPPRMGLSKAVNFTKPTVHYFAVDSVVEGRLWMAALMKATIDRDDSQPMTTTYSQQTISLAKARQMQQLPPALKDLDEKREQMEEQSLKSSSTSEHVGLNLKNVDVNGDAGGDDSGVSGMGKQSEEAKKTYSIDATSTTTASKPSSDLGSEARAAA